MEAAGVVTVTGQGRASGAPAAATVNLGVEVRAATATEALALANERAASLVAAIRGFGVAGDDLHTRDVSLYPQFDNTGQTVTGYVASNQVSATIRDIDRVGEALDGVARQVGESVRVNGLTFAITDATDLLRAAREAAVADARDRAVQLAGLAGGRLGPVVEIVEGSGPGTPMPRQAKAMMAFDGAVPIEAGTQAVSVGVSVTYRLIEVEG